MKLSGVDMKKHLSKNLALKLAKHQTNLDIEREAFLHWRECPECQSFLKNCMERAGFSAKPQLYPGEAFVEECHSLFEIQVIATENYLLSVSLCHDDFRTLHDLFVHLEWKVSPSYEESLTHKIVKSITQFFELGTPFLIPEINPFLIKSDFAQEVLYWTWLIPFGKTVTYGEIACWIGKPQAARAVGGALHGNPLPLIIPCHRVLGSDGSLTGFSGGLSMKRKLLELERSI